MSDENQQSNPQSSGATGHQPDAAANLESAKAHAKEAAEQLKGAAEAKVREIREKAEAKAQELRSTAEARVHEFRERAESKYGEARARSRTLQEDGEAYIRENPTRAVITAAIAGFLLAALLRK